PEGQRIGALSLFSLVYTTSAAALYFALGLIAQRALGLTPLVFLGGGLFLGLAAMSYTEGVLGHPEPGGSSSLTRFAFNELISFAAGWAVVLDFLVVIALAATTAASYLGTLWTPVGHGLGRTVVTCAVIGYAVASSIRGGSISAVRTRIIVAIADIGVQALLLVLGAFLMFHPELLSDSIHLGSSPTWTNLIYAFTLATAAFTGIEAAASLAPEIKLNGVGFRRLIAGGVGVIVMLHVGIAFVGLSALPVTNGVTALGGKWLNAPLVGVARGISPGSWGHLLGQVVAISGFVGLATASRSAMTGVSRLAYSLARHRQIPRVVARLSSRYGTPWMILILAGLAAAALALPADIEMLGGLYAFGAMLAITLTHASVVRLRVKGELAEGAWSMPLSVRFRGGTVPLPALFGAIVSALAFVAVMALHAPARYVGSAWLLGGVVLYVIYRKLMGNSVFDAVEVSDRALVYERESASYGSILVPILGSALDDDIVQTAGRLAGATKDELDEHGAVIEAIWFHEIPLSLPLDASISPERSADALERLRHAKAVGEEYQGVTVSTAQVRVRKLGQGIVREAKRRGVDVIVLPGEEPTRAARTAPASRGKQAGLGEMTRFVLRKAHCRVLVTVPSSNVAGTRSRPEDGGEPEGG
ncbi:MAG: amino acid permease, partial [Solirubrobacterales bacterium]|nr:amino acid permease [Solirubrobacterales bacterium]